MNNWISNSERQFWADNGYLVQRGFLASRELGQVSTWAKELEELPETAERWMKYFETPMGGAAGRQLCRIENFLPFHSGLDGLLRGERVLGAVSELIGEEAVIFKEKLDFKLPGGNGFAPHQDAPAFTTFGQTYHVTMAISVDASTRENGCLEFAAGMHRAGVLPTECDLTLRRELAERLDWTPVPTEAGDAVFFDSLAPHRSDPNRTSTPRRMLYVTYNAASQGSVRDAYFAAKRAAFPPDVERQPGVKYDAHSVFNLGNPIRVDDKVGVEGVRIRSKDEG